MTRPSLPAASSGVTTAAGPALVCRPLEPVRRPSLHHAALGAWRARRQPTATDADLAAVAAAAGVSAADARSRPSRSMATPSSWPQRLSASRGRRHHRDRRIRRSLSPFRPPTACRCSSRIVRTGAVAAAHAGWRGLAARVPSGGRGARDGVPRAPGRISSPRSARRSARAAMKWACDVRDAFGARGLSARRRLERWFSEQPTPSAANPSMAGLRRAAGRITGSSMAGRRLASSSEAAGVPPDQIRRSRALHREPSDRVLLVPARRRAGRPHGGRDQASAARP